MPDYKKMYLRLFGATEDAIELLSDERGRYWKKVTEEFQEDPALLLEKERARVRSAIALLIAAQRDCEEMVMSEPEVPLILLPGGQGTGQQPEEGADPAGAERGE